LFQSAIVAASRVSGHYVFMRLMVYELVLSDKFDLPCNGFVLNRVVSYMVATSGSYVQYTHGHGDGCVLALFHSASVAATLLSGHHVYMHLRVY